VSEPILEVTGVRKVYRVGVSDVVALQDRDLRVSIGEFVAVMGPSGSGKTTLLNCLSGLDDIDAGSVRFDGQPLHEPTSSRSCRNTSRSGCWLASPASASSRCAPCGSVDATSPYCERWGSTAGASAGRS
jgi:ABC-type oligopeptide transport system ATPase subunit